jgi:formylglycine-generating enzyme required for sulfatase activity/dienelactone hydrolase
VQPSGLPLLHPMSSSQRFYCLLLTVVLFLPMAFAHDLVRIPARSYTAVDERTNIRTNIRVDEFLLSPTEITADEYAAVMGANPSSYKGGNLPVQNVSWWDAVRYCNARSVREGLEPCYDLSSGRCNRNRNGYRLPTEAEWLSAAGEDDKGNPQRDLAVIATIGSRDTKDLDALMGIVRRGPTSVGIHHPNHLGIYDMIGNVWEWCEDWFDSVISYPSTDNPQGPAWGIGRILRGGSFVSSASAWVKGYRTSMEPNTRSRFAGFRVCRTAVGFAPLLVSEPQASWFKPYNERPTALDRSAAKLSPLLQSGSARITSLTQWQTRAAALRAKWHGLLGTCPAELQSPAFRSIRVFHEPEYTGTLAALQVEADSSEDVFVMVPNRPTDKPRPVVIVPFYDVDESAGKDMGGRRYAPPGVKSFALLAVQQGWIAIAVRWFGESYGESYSEAVANLQLRHPGCTGLGKWVSDAHQVVNYLDNRPDVDSTRIAVIGHSLGGKMALYAAAFDERIRITIASEPGIGFGQSNYDDYWYFGKQILGVSPGTDQHELLALIAPRPFLLIGGDHFDGKNSWPYIDAARQVYGLYGADRRIGYLNHHQGHAPTPDAAWRAIEWIRHFIQSL